jgi:membrane protease subunit (stomatin/prohibitin family)
MAAPLNTCTTIEQRGVERFFLWAKSMDVAKDIHKEMLPIWARSGN